MWRDGQLIVRTTTILTKKTQTLATYAGNQPERSSSFSRVSSDDKDNNLLGSSDWMASHCAMRRAQIE